MLKETESRIRALLQDENLADQILDLIRQDEAAVTPIWFGGKVKD